MRKTIIGILLVSTLLSLPFAVLAAQEVPEDAPVGAIRPDNGGCPGGYSQISYSMGIFSIKLCVPTGNNPPPDPQPDPGPNPPTPPPDPNPDPDPRPEPNNGNNPPAFGSPPSKPDNPGGYSSPPSNEKNRALNEKPEDESFALRAVRRNNLYFYYRGSYTSTAATYLGQWIPIYVNLPSGGNLQVYEKYYRSGRSQTYNWGYRPPGWTKFWFYADTRGWHALISNTNGSWGNWIWVYVY